MMTQLKDHIRRMLLEFIHEIEAAKWQGKERELVSHFAFSKLVKNVGCCPEFPMLRRLPSKCASNK